MKKYSLTAKITVSAFCDVEANSAQEAIEKSKSMGAGWHSYNTGTSRKESWCVEEIDGEPAEIEAEEINSTAIAGYYPVPCSGFFIVNDFDCPYEERIAQQRADGKFYYIHPTLRKVKRYWGMTPENPTPLESFGISIAVIGGEFRGCHNNESKATYRDGRPRRWQGEGLFSFSFQNTGTSRKESWCVEEIDGEPAEIEAEG